MRIVSNWSWISAILLLTSNPELAKGESVLTSRAHMVVICLLCLFCGGLSLRRNPVLRRHLLLSSFEWRDLLLLVAGVNLTGNSMTPLPGRGTDPFDLLFPFSAV